MEGGVVFTIPFFFAQNADLIRVLTQNVTLSPNTVKFGFEVQNWRQYTPDDQFMPSFYLTSSEPSVIDMDTAGLTFEGLWELLMAPGQGSMELPFYFADFNATFILRASLAYLADGETGRCLIQCTNIPFVFFPFQLIEKILLLNLQTIRRN